MLEQGYGKIINAGSMAAVFVPHPQKQVRQARRHHCERLCTPQQLLTTGVSCLHLQACPILNQPS